MYWHGLTYPHGARVALLTTGAKVPGTPGEGAGQAYDSSVFETNLAEVTAVNEDPATLEAGAEDAVALLSAVADPVRWTVLQRLAQSPACVCNLQEHVPVAANLLSYHLKVLREAGLVTTSRRGRWIDYALADDAMVRLQAALPGAGTALR